jgi:hypothetical protein
VRVLAVWFFSEEADAFYPGQANLDEWRNGIAVLRARIHHPVNLFVSTSTNSFANLVRQIRALNTMIAKEYVAVPRYADQYGIFFHSTGLWTRMRSDGPVYTIGIAWMRQAKPYPDENRKHHTHESPQVYPAKKFISSSQSV